MHSRTRRPGAAPFYRSRLRRWSGPLALLVCGLLASLDAAAWGAQGHRIAGTLTAQWLSPEAARAVRDLLGDEPLAAASTWADDMRSDPAPFWQRRAGPWHYVTVPPGGRYEPGQAGQRGDALTALAQFSRELRDPRTPRARQQLALRFGLHIVQDLQQPLHAGGRNDRGGNDFGVRINGKRSNLHRVWDSQLLSSTGLSDEGWLDRLAPLIRNADTEAWMAVGPLTWVAESVRISQDIYPERSTITSGYLRRFTPVAAERLAQAGLRSAAWLNAVYAAPDARRRSVPSSLEHFVEKGLD